MYYNPIYKPGEKKLDKNNNMASYKISKWMITSFFLICLIFYIILDHTKLPDYGSYLKIYNSSGLNTLNNWDPLYIFINLTAKHLNLSYVEFRGVIFCLSICMFFIALNIIYKKEKTKRNNLEIQTPNINAIYYLLVALVLNIFFFEFFFVRIRAGLALSFLTIGYSFIWPKLYFKLRIFKPLPLIFIFLGAFIHFNTFLTIVYLVFIPLTVLYLYSKFKILKKRIFIKYFFLIFLASSILMQYNLLVSFRERGENLFSPLNPIRFIALTIPPILLYSFFFLKKNWNYFRKEIKYSFLNQDENEESIQFKDVFHYIITMNYFISLIILFMFQILGLLNNAGEAIVRVFTLSSIIAIYVIMDSSKPYFYFWLYVLISNSLFFYNTVFGI